jgi:hypothetical protein
MGLDHISEELSHAFGDYVCQAIQSGCDDTETLEETRH